MQNSETTLDNLTVLGVESKSKKNGNNNFKNIKNKKPEILSNNKKKKIDNNNNDSENNNKNDTGLNGSNDISSDINCGNNVDVEDFSGDTNDLININFYSFEEMKKII